MKLDLVNFGNVTIDDVVMWDGTTKMGCFGGDTIYASFAASWWSDNVAFVAPIGADFPRNNLEVLQKAGWMLDGLQKRSVPTIRNWVIYEQDGRRSWVMRSDPEDFFELSPTPEDIPTTFLQSKSFLILAMELRAQENLVEFLHKQKKILALDLKDDDVKNNEDRILKMVSCVDIFMPSKIEMSQLTGHQDPHRAAKEFSEMGCSIIVIKLDREGSLIYDRNTDTFHEIPAYRVNVVDSTGAGDAYCGGFVAKYVTSGDLKLAGIAGNVSASFAIQDYGCDHMLGISNDAVQNRFFDLFSKIES